MAVSKKAAPKLAIKAPVKPIKESLTKTALIERLAEQSGVERKETKAVLAALEDTIKASVHKRGVGQFTMPGLFKAVVMKVPAKKKRKGINPFTKEAQVFAAKPASVKIKLRPLKGLKDAAA